MNKHVPNLTNCLALDKALKAKGMKPMETMFWWCYYNDVEKWILHYESLSYDINVTEKVIAPLVSELGEMWKDTEFDLPWFDGKYWSWSCLSEDECCIPTEADARCQMLTYLINEGLIS